VVFRTSLRRGIHLSVRIGAFAIALIGCLVVLPVMAARALGGQPPQPGPELAALAPVATPVAGLALAGAFLARMRWWSVVPASLFVTLLAWQVVPSTAAWWHTRFGPVTTSAVGRPANGGGQMHVFTLNAEYGRVDAAALVAQVRRHEVDVLTVQELTPELVGRLAAAGLNRELPFQVLRPEQGFSGTGIWSRWPTTPLGDVPGTESATPRTLVQPPNGPRFALIAVHPTAPAGQGSEQLWRSDLQHLRAAIAEATGPASAPASDPLVVAGDFNATRDHALFRDLLSPGLDDALDTAPNSPWLGFTFPADREYPPIMRLDHVLYSTQDLACASAATVAVPGTDHRGVIATLRFG
jgi:endonuclease/exonuclease/phosphatase (EEP) superfamily protein YafD